MCLRICLSGRVPNLIYSAQNAFLIFIYSLFYFPIVIPVFFHDIMQEMMLIFSSTTAGIFGARCSSDFCGWAVGGWPDPAVAEFSRWYRVHWFCCSHCFKTPLIHSKQVTQVHADSNNGFILVDFETCVNIVWCWIVELLVLRITAANRLHHLPLLLQLRLQQLQLLLRPLLFLPAILLQILPSVLLH